MTNTPEQIIADLLALGGALPYGDLQSRAVWMETTHPSPIFEAVPLTLTHQKLERLLQFFAASKNALPAIRSLMEVAEAARGLLNNFDELDRMTNVEEIERLESALSRLGGK